MQLYDIKVLIAEQKNRFKIVEEKFAGLNNNLKKLEEEELDPSFFADLEKAKKLARQKKDILKKLDDIKQTKLAIADMDAEVELVEEGLVEFCENDLLAGIKSLTEKIEDLWVKTLLNKEYDDASAIVVLHSGAGGEEAQDWAEMLMRMYIRYAEKAGFSVTMLDKVAGDGAGIKSATLLIDGENAYGNLRTEKGVHRLVRLSPFDANNRRHTSFASVEVSPYVDEPSKVEINDKDLKIDTYRSSGAGGQHVNKTDSAIRITHLPTGIVVQCQNERSQLQNKEMALKMLASKLTEKMLAEKEAEKQKKLGENKKIEWGSQIRSYVLHPYNLVKDHRTNLETANTKAVLDGDIQPFINEFLKISE